MAIRPTVLPAMLPDLIFRSFRILVSPVWSDIIGAIGRDWNLSGSLCRRQIADFPDCRRAAPGKAWRMPRREQEDASEIKWRAAWESLSPVVGRGLSYLRWLLLACGSVLVALLAIGWMLESEQHLSLPFECQLDWLQLKERLLQIEKIPAWRSDVIRVERVTAVNPGQAWKEYYGPQQYFSLQARDLKDRIEFLMHDRHCRARDISSGYQASGGCLQARLLIAPGAATTTDGQVESLERHGYILEQTTWYPHTWQRALAWLAGDRRLQTLAIDLEQQLCSGAIE
ncbi:MAG: hypothetical protein KDK39_05180 [Leptospiraceae bacterium]|nr:hypothetical protein [Leptospiraceae bacterium]